MNKQQINVAEKLDQLLQRCDALRRGSDIDRPVMFDARGQRHAAGVAAADAGGSTCFPRSVRPE